MSFNFIYLLNGVSYLAVAIIAFYIFFVWYKKKELICKTGKIVGISGFFFLILAFLNFLWSFNFLTPSVEEFILIKSTFTIIKATLLLFVVYEIISDKKLFYLLFLFLVSVFGFQHDITNFFLFILGISYLLILLISLDLVFFSNFYLKRAGLIGLAYSYVSLFLIILIFLGQNPSKSLWFIPNILMFFIFLLLFLDVKHCGIIKGRETKYRTHKKIETIFVFAKFLIFITSISAFIFFSVVAVHELGHALTAQFYGCEYGKAVVYDITDFPHTEIECNSYYSEFVVTIAGLVFTLVVGLILLLTGGKFTTRLSYLIFGFALFIPYGDLVDLDMSKNIIAIILFSSVIIIAIAIVKISAYYLRQQNIIYKQKATEPSKIKPENYFILKDGTTIKNLYELAQALNIMDNSTFKYHINEQKNDFSNWVRDVIGDEVLAKELLHIKNKNNARMLILKRLISQDIVPCLETKK